MRWLFLSSSQLPMSVALIFYLLSVWVALGEVRDMLRKPTRQDRTPNSLLSSATDRAAYLFDVTHPRAQERPNLALSLNLSIAVYGALCNPISRRRLIVSFLFIFSNQSVFFFLNTEQQNASPVNCVTPIWPNVRLLLVTSFVHHYKKGEKKHCWNIHIWK